MSNINPDILAMFEEENTYIKNSGKNYAKRVKLEEGESWLLRFLPAKLGPRQAPFARIAFHWFNKRPTLCIRETGEDFGGVRDGKCPLCALAEQLNDSDNQAVSSLGYKTMANPQYLTYALVFEKDDGKHAPEVIKGAERWEPYEYLMNKTVFQEFYGFYRKGLTRSENSILDVKTGSDFWVMQQKRGVKLDRQEASPLVSSKDPARDEQLIEEILSKIKMQKQRVPDEKVYREMIAKIKEAAAGLDDSYSSPRRSRYTDDDDDRSAPPERSSRRGYEEDDAPAKPVRSSRVEEEIPPARSRSSRPVESGEEDYAPRRAASHPAKPDIDDRDADGERDDAPPARVERAEPPAARRGGHVESSVDDDDNAPEERRDLAPPSRSVETDDMPPAVTGATSAPTRGGLSSRLRDGIRGANNRS